jgi:hypothetical protein
MGFSCTGYHLRADYPPAHARGGRLRTYEHSPVVWWGIRCIVHECSAKQYR